MSRQKSAIFTFSVLSFALLLLIILAKPDLAFAGCNTVTISGSMEGNLPIAAGSTVSAGYDFTIPGNHPAANVTFMNGSVTVQVICPDNTVHPLIVSLPTQTYSDPLNDNDWFPSGVQSSPSVYQGSTVSNACGTQTGHAPKGATFTAKLCSSDGVENLNVRFHYMDHSAGNWSGTRTATLNGPQAGDVLIAGGDISGTLLGGVINLSTSTNSTTAAEVYESGLDKFLTVGSLKNSREAVYSAVPLPNLKTLVAGGSFCHPQCYNSGGTIPTGGTSRCGVGGPACGTKTFTGFQCDALNTAELYSEGMSSFALTPKMTTARSGPTATLITGSGTALDGKVLVTGGSTGSTFLGLSGGTATPAGCGPAGQVAENTAEIYDPVANSFTSTGSIPGCPAGESPFTTPACFGLPAVCPNGVYTPITTASQSGHTVTITDTTNPAGLIVGAGVTILGLSPNNLNGVFPVASIGTGTFTYHSAVSQTATGSGNGVSVADTFQCGLVDSSAALLGNGDVLITGGDYQQFLGSSSPQAFIFIPGAQTFVQVPPMNVARELAGITPLPDGRVLVAGGLTGASGSCAQQNLPGEVSVTTNSSAEIFDPFVSPPTWTLTFGSSATPGAPGGMTVPRIATAELFTVGPDAGLAILAGGVNVEAGDPTTTPPSCAPVVALSQTAQTATDLFDETADAGTGAFTPTGPLNQAREGYAVAILDGSAKFANDLIVFGGACTTNAFGLDSFVIGTSSAGNCSPPAPPSNYYEYFDPTTGTWTLGTGGVPATPANNPAYALLP